MLGEDESLFEDATFEASATATEELEQPPANEATYEYQTEAILKQEEASEPQP